MISQNVRQQAQGTGSSTRAGSGGACNAVSSASLGADSANRGGAQSIAPWLSGQSRLQCGKSPPCAELRGTWLPTGRVALMGVLNVTPNSFFDGGKYLSGNDAQARVDELVQEGADIIDLGAESSKPGAKEVSDAEQLRRLDEPLCYATEQGLFVSVDTTSAEVARVALGRGAQMINDVSCLRNPDLASVAADANAFLVITHSRKPQSQMPGFSEWPQDDYQDVVGEVTREWQRARDIAVRLGVSEQKLLFDPGLGFSKNADQSYALLRGLRQFRRLGVPILVGPGRKSFIAAADPSPPSERLGGTIAASLVCAESGCDVIRVHDVRECRQALRVLSACRNPERSVREDGAGYRGEGKASESTR